jgi:hypothetical protein
VKPEFELQYCKKKERSYQSSNRRIEDTTFHRGNRQKSNVTAVELSIEHKAKRSAEK